MTDIFIVARAPERVIIIVNGHQYRWVVDFLVQCIVHLFELDVKKKTIIENAQTKLGMFNRNGITKR